MFGRLRVKLCPDFGRSRARPCPISFAPCPFPNPTGSPEHRSPIPSSLTHHRRITDASRRFHSAEHRAPCTLYQNRNLIAQIESTPALTCGSSVPKPIDNKPRHRVLPPGHWRLKRRICWLFHANMCKFDAEIVIDKDGENDLNLS